jgi:hypothetical protein
MNPVVVRYRTTEEGAEHNQQLVEKVFQELAETRPDGLRYATFRLADGVSFVHVASVETADGSNPLSASAAFAEFQRELPDRCVEQPVPSAATLVGSYGFFG